MSCVTDEERSYAVSLSLDTQGEPRVRRQAFTNAQRTNIAICRKWTCEKCGRKNLHDTLGWDVDHIKEVADGGTNEQTNLQLLCATCHADKTRVNQMVRAAAKRVRSARDNDDDDDGVVDQVRDQVRAETKRHRALQKSIWKTTEAQFEAEKKRHEKQMEEILARRNASGSNTRNTRNAPTAASDGVSAPVRAETTRDVPVEESRVLPKSVDVAPVSATADEPAENKPPVAASGRAPTFRCVNCGDLPQSEFWPSSMRHAHHRCKTCARNLKREYRKKCPPALAAAVKETREREQVDTWTFDQHKTVLERYNGRCVVTGESQGLTLCKLRENEPFGVDNAAPMCVKAAKKWNYVVPDLQLPQ